METDTAMAAEWLDARGRGGAVDAIAPHAQPEPVGAQWIVGAGRHFLQNGFPLAAHFFLDGFWYQPGLVLHPRDEPEFALRRGPAGLAQAHGVGGTQDAQAEVEEHALREDDDDGVGEPRP